MAPASFVSKTFRSRLVDQLPFSWRFFRRLTVLLTSSTLMLIAAGSAIGAVDAPRPVVGTDTAERSWIPGEVPDLELLVAGLRPDDPRIDTLIVPTVQDIPGITAVVTETLVNGRTALHVSLADPSRSDLAATIVAEVQLLAPETQVSTGGRATLDNDLLARLNRGAVIAAVPVLFLMALALSAAFGLRVGIAVSGTVGLATLLGGAMAQRLAGPFDGALTTTALPGLLVALLVSSVLAFRLLDWFKYPVGADHAEYIRRSIRHLLPELVLFFGGLAATAVVLELLSSGRSPATVMLVGSAIAVIVTLSVLPAVLATSTPLPNDDRFALFQIPTPDGRHFPTAVLAGFAGVLLLLGVLAAGNVSSDMLDASALPPGEASRRVSEQLVQSGGDPSDAIVATLAITSEAEVAAWAAAVSNQEFVGWVESSAGRFVDGTRLDQPPAPGLAGVDQTQALIAPVVAGRSLAAQSLVSEIEALSPVGSQLGGVPVDARASSESARSLLWLSVGLLALAAGVAVHILMRDLFLSAVTVALRLLGTAASLGIFHLITDSVSGSELQILALLVNLGVGLFELGFLRRIAMDRGTAGADETLVGVALREEGRAAMLGLGFVAVFGLGFVLSDLEVARRLGVAVAAGAVIELLIGTWLLRPAVLGTRAAGAVAPRPAFTLRPITTTPAVASAEDNDEIELTAPAIDTAEWRRIVAGLLRAEFECQSFPDRAALETIFVEGTPLFDEVAVHNRRLVDTGLRVTGRGPTIHQVSAVNPGSPVTLSMVVDHPVRHLIDASGRQIGQRAAERREGMLWLVQDPSGRYRIAEAVDLGVVEPVADLTEPKVDLTGAALAHPLGTPVSV